MSEKPVCHLVWLQGRRAADDVEDYYAVARPGDKSVDGSDPFPVFAEPREKWIDVNDRLPGEQGHDSEEVSLFLNGHCGLLDHEKRNGGGWGYCTGYYDAERGCFRVHGSPDAFVTHWQPLPAAPSTTNPPTHRLCQSNRDMKGRTVRSITSDLLDLICQMQVEGYEDWRPRW